MKVKVGKFYRNRIGEKSYVTTIRGEVARLSNGHSVWVDTGTTWRTDRSLYRDDDNDIIEEWKEPEVKEPKFKVGDRVRDLRWDGKTVGTVISYDRGEYQVDYRPHEFGICSGYEDNYSSRLELVEPAKPENTIGSRWQSKSEPSFSVEIIHINANGLPVMKALSDASDSEFKTGDIFDFYKKQAYDFWDLYEPLVEPPKSLVGYVGIHSHRGSGNISFGAVFESEEAVATEFSVMSPFYELVAVKKIEWTEGNDG